MEQWNAGIMGSGPPAQRENGNVGYCKIHLDRELNK
jgi:hypothetical protein